MLAQAFAADPDTKKTEPPADNTTSKDQEASQSSQDAFKKAGEDSEKVKEDDSLLNGMWTVGIRHRHFCVFYA